MYEQRTKKGLKNAEKCGFSRTDFFSTTIREPIPFRDLHTWATILIIFYSCLSDFKRSWQLGYEVSYSGIQF